MKISIALILLLCTQCNYSFELMYAPTVKYKTIYYIQDSLTYAGAIFDCCCKQEISVENAFKENKCPFCGKCDQEKINEFKNLLLEHAFKLYEPIERVKYLIENGAAFKEELLKKEYVLKYLQKNPELINIFNIDHAKIIKYFRRRLNYTLDLSLVAGKNQLKPEDFLNLLLDGPAFIYKFDDTIYSYIEEYNDDEKEDFFRQLLYRGYGFGHFKYCLDLANKFNIDLKDKSYFEDCVRNKIKYNKISFDQLLELDLPQNIISRLNDIISLEDLESYQKIFGPKSLEDFPESNSKIQKLIFSNDSYDNRTALNYIDLLKLYLPRDTRGNSLQMRLVMLDRLDLLGNLPEDSSVNKDGFDNLSWSVLSGSKNCFSYLLDKSDLDHFDNDGRTTLMMTINSNQTMMLYKLLRKKANYKAIDFDGINCFEHVKNSSSYKIKAVFYTMVIKDKVENKIGKLFNNIKSRYLK